MIKNDLSDYKVKIIDRFLTNQEIAAYRMATDIYINMKKIWMLSFLFAIMSYVLLGLNFKM